MEPKEFKGQNVVYGKDQPKYKPLPALRLPGDQGEVITCWEFSAEELEDIVKNKCFYLSQLTFNNPLQPIRPFVNLEDGLDLK